MSFDLVIVGSGFAATFFLREYLAHASADARVLVLERGEKRSHQWQVENRGKVASRAAELIVNKSPDKPWVFSTHFGGGSNCWWACTPRMLPADFQLKTEYGVGVDWPVDYDELEPFYQTAEDWMHVSGPSEHTPFARSKPYPQPPHRWSTPDEALGRAFEDFYVQPTARARRGTGRRPQCCANATCTTCPIDAKFRIQNEMADVFEDPRVELRTGARVDSLELQGDRVVEATYVDGQKQQTVQGDRFALGANAIFNAHILLRSGHQHPQLGRGLVEQASATVNVDLADMRGFDGSTSLTGHGYMFYDGVHRKKRAAALVETSNVPTLRMEPGKWANRLVVKFIYGDLRQDQNRVTSNPDDPRPIIEWKGHSAYTTRAMNELDKDLDRLLATLPVERRTTRQNTTEAHVIGTAPMGTDGATSVVDPDLVDHRYRNLWVLGSSSFPTAPPANPTLTICALAIRAARRAFATEAHETP